MKNSQESSNFIVILKGAGIGLVGKIVGSIIEFGYAVLLARMLEITILGYYLFGLSIFRFAHAFAVGGLDYAGRKYVSQSKNLINIAIIFIRRWFKSVLLIYTLLIVLSVLGSSFNPDPLERKAVYWFVGMAPLGAIIAIVVSIFQGMKNIKLSSIIKDILVPLVRLVIVLPFLWLGLKLEAPLYAYFISLIVVSMIALYKFLYPLRNQLKYFSSISSHKEGFSYKTVINYSSPMMITTIINLSVIWGTTFLIGFLSTPEEVSLFSVSARVAMLSSILLMSINTIFEPVIAELSHGNETYDLVKVYRQTTTIIIGVMIPIVFLGIMFSHSVMSLFGVEFIKAFPILIILLIGQFIGVLSGPAGNILIMTGYQTFSLLFNSIISLIVVILNVILIPKIGVTGAAISASLGLAMKNTISLIFLYIKERIHPINSTNLFLVIFGMSGILLAVVFNNSLIGYYVTVVYMFFLLLTIYYKGYYRFFSLVISPRIDKDA